MERRMLSKIVLNLFIATAFSMNFINIMDYIMMVQNIIHLKKGK